MEDILKSINAISGVRGSFVCDSKGKISASAMPDTIAENILTDASHTISQTLVGLAPIQRRKIDDIELVFGGGRLVIKNLGESYLSVLCMRNINVPLLNITANLAIKKLADMAVELSERGKQVTREKEAWNARAQFLNDEAQSIIHASRKQNVILQATGDTAIRLCCPNASNMALKLEDQVLDLVGRDRQATQIKRILTELGYSPDRTFNVLHGAQRLRLIHPEKRLGVEVYLNELNMYHKLNLTESLSIDTDTIPMADLLLWKLQYVEADEDTLKSIYAILNDHDLGGPGEVEKINTLRIIDLCSSDWGWFKTVTLNLGKCINWAESQLGESDSIFLERARRLMMMINEAPKSGGWQVRARIGENLRWYETPE